jgi:hypothetical protein
MSKKTFDFLVSEVEPMLSRHGYFSRERPGISLAEWMAVTPRYLGSGDSQTSLAFQFRMDRSTVCNIICESSATIWEGLQPSWVQIPRNAAEWKNVSDQFQSMWNFPKCVGTIDGKHIVIQAPVKSGSS